MIIQRINCNLLILLMMRQTNRLMHLLVDNYFGIRSEDRTRCEREVSNYLGREESVGNNHVVFVKRITKVASNLINSGNTSLDLHLEKLRDFNLEGANIIDRGITSQLNGVSKMDLDIMRCHFYSYAGDCSTRLFKLNENVADAHDAFILYSGTAIVGADVDRKHSIINLMKAADLAWGVAPKSGDERLVWIRRGIDSNLEAAELSNGFDGFLRSRNLYLASQKATQVYTILRDKGSLNEAYNLNLEAAGACLGLENNEQALKAYERAARLAIDNCDNNGNRPWFNEFVYCKYKLAEIERNSVKANRHYKEVGDYANNKYESTRDEFWKGKAIEAYSKLLKVMEGDSGLSRRFGRLTLQTRLERFQNLA